MLKHTLTNFTKMITFHKYLDYFPKKYVSIDKNLYIYVSLRNNAEA